MFASETFHLSDMIKKLMPNKKAKMLINLPDNIVRTNQLAPSFHPAKNGLCVVKGSAEA